MLTACFCREVSKIVANKSRRFYFAKESNLDFSVSQIFLESKIRKASSPNSPRAPPPPPYAAEARLTYGFRQLTATRFGALNVGRFELAWPP